MASVNESLSDSSTDPISHSVLKHLDLSIALPQVQLIKEVQITDKTLEQHVSTG